MKDLSSVEKKSGRGFFHERVILNMSTFNCKVD